METFSLGSLEKYKLASNLTTQAIKNHKTERGILLEEMLAEINKERVSAKYAPMSIKVFAIKMGKRDIKELYELNSKARDYKNRQGSYGKYLFGIIKVKK